ncbi:MAG TPA: hypothetical protein VHB98_23890 [Chloroflexota bacterium]|jgi:hypothetical protein|nr:hypothetical protein [Chloroflexota bacterium]
MSAELVQRRPTASSLARNEEATLLEGILAYSPHLTARQRKRLIASVMGHGGIATLPAQAERGASPAAILLHPGLVQAEALALNYALLFALDVSGSLQYSTLPMQATVIAVNYLVLTGLMMSLSLLCLVHAFVRWDLRNVYRALVVAMGVTGAFGMIESIVFTAPFAYLGPAKVLFMATIPLISALIALCSMARGFARPARAHVQHVPEQGTAGVEYERQER